jgi:hypothetical protein
MTGVMKKILLSLLVLGSMMFAGCVEENDTPMGYVNFTINPNSTFYTNLNHVGGYEYFIGGYKGVIIFRYSWTEFLAYERACPHCHELIKPHTVCSACGFYDGKEVVKHEAEKATEA